MKKAQISFEFVTTYGWAIAIALAAVGALAYVGFTNPTKVLPDKGVFSNGLVWQDSRVTSNAINISLVNGLGQTIYQINASADGFTATCTSSSTTLSGDGVLRINCNGISGVSLVPTGKVKLKFKINYQRVVGGYTQVSLGEIYATVQ